MIILDKQCLTFDDVLLTPRYSSIQSRFSNEINLSVKLNKKESYSLRYPIISANMDTVTGNSMAKAMEEFGGLGIIHRFMSFEEHLKQLKTLEKYKILCLGVGNEAISRYKFITDHLFVDGVLIDIAHGDSSSVLTTIDKIKHLRSDEFIISGNIATKSAARMYAENGVNCIKVGVGPGAICSTRINTGCGVPQLTAIMEVKEGIDRANCSKQVSVIADGGIRNPGDAMKALAAGADAIMVGSLLAGTEETPGEKLTRRDGTIVKKYRGMASKEFQEEAGKTQISVEGVTITVPYKGPVKETLQLFVNNLLSGMSYQNAHSIFELQENAIFIRQTTAGYRESIPHGLLSKQEV